MTTRSAIPASTVTPSPRRGDDAVRVDVRSRVNASGADRDRPPGELARSRPSPSTTWRVPRKCRPSAAPYVSIEPVRCSRRERVGRVLHRVGRDDERVVAVDVRGLEVALEGDRDGQVADPMRRRPTRSTWTSADRRTCRSEFGPSSDHADAASVSARAAVAGDRDDVAEGAPRSPSRGRPRAPPPAPGTSGRARTAGDEDAVAEPEPGLVAALSVQLAATRRPSPIAPSASAARGRSPARGTSSVETVAGGAPSRGWASIELELLGLGHRQRDRLRAPEHRVGARRTGAPRRAARGTAARPRTAARPPPRTPHRQPSRAKVDRRQPRRSPSRPLRAAVRASSQYGASEERHVIAPARVARPRRSTETSLKNRTGVRRHRATSNSAGSRPPGRAAVRARSRTRPSSSVRPASSGSAPPPTSSR